VVMLAAGPELHPKSRKHLPRSVAPTTGTSKVKIEFFADLAGFRWTVGGRITVMLTCTNYADVDCTCLKLGGNVYTVSGYMFGGNRCLYICVVGVSLVCVDTVLTWHLTADLATMCQPCGGYSGIYLGLLGYFWWTLEPPNAYFTTCYYL
jgi:hypothetical protein